MCTCGEGLGFHRCIATCLPKTLPAFLLKREKLAIKGRAKVFPVESIFLAPLNLPSLSLRRDRNSKGVAVHGLSLNQTVEN